MIKISLFYLGMISVCFANFHLAPPVFKYKDSNAIFINITKGTYDIKYYPNKLKSKVKTTWLFETKEEGYPLFDFVPKKMGIRLNGIPVRFSTIESPDKVTSYKVVNKKLMPGTHKLEIWTKVKNGTKYGFKSVNSGFFIKDLTEKKFLEKYVPANLEYDQYPMTFNVRVFSSKKHIIVANGEIEQKGQNSYSIRYPDYYSSSSIYFHVFKKGKYKWVNSSVQSIDGRVIPITIYTKGSIDIDPFLNKTLEYFRELEKDYGPMPHPKIIIYGMALRGGMEYPGATATSLRSLGHEMFHFYFAKGVIPADGNSGWMDEGLASWRDKGYKTLDHPGFESFNLGAHSVYKRNTDDNSYRVGRAFFAYINSKINLKTILKEYFAKHKHSLVTTNDMINFFEEKSGLNLRGDFNQFVLNNTHLRKNYVEVVENIHHPVLNEQELDNIL